MKRLRRAWKRLAGSLAGHRQEAELADEIESHIQRLVEDNIRRGTPPDEARRLALVTFGGVEAAKEKYRDQRGLPWLETLRQDIRFAFRCMWKSPIFTAVAVSCVALGIGSNTAIFSIINAVTMRTLPVRQPEQLVLFSYESTGRRSWSSSGYGNWSLSYGTYQTLLRDARTLSDVIAFAHLGFTNHSLTVNTGRQSTVASGKLVSSNYFSALGILPILGRTIVEADLKPDAPNVAMISYPFWMREYGGEQSAVGKTVVINSLAFTIVGVTPVDFFGLDPGMAVDLWIPLRDFSTLRPYGVQNSARQSIFVDNNWWWCTIVGRLKPGITLKQAYAEADVLFSRSITEGMEEVPSPEELPYLVITPARHGLGKLRREYSQPLMILTGAAVLILLIVCSNVATLLLARAMSRQREVGIRLAVGASRPRLICQFLTESIVLSLCGGVFGLALAHWGSHAILLMMSSRGQAIALDVHLNAMVFAFSVGVSMLSGIVFGLVPALRGTRKNLVPQLKENTGSSTPRLTLAKPLVGAQVALSVLLLVGAGLFVRTLQKLETENLGFNRSNLLLFDIDPRRNGYDGRRAISTYNDMIERIQALPGVRSATSSALALLSGWHNKDPISTDGVQLPPGRPNGVHYNWTGPDFFETLDIRIVIGRGIEWRDFGASARVAVVNEALASNFFPDGSPLGRHFSFGSSYDPAKAYEIVGVVQNAKYSRLREKPPRTAYLSYASALEKARPMCFEVRTAGDPYGMVEAVREAVRAADPQLPMINIRTQADQLDEALTQERMFAFMSSLFGFLALLLVSIGLYGTLAYSVMRRTSEIGIRMALGANRLQVLWMVLRESLLLAGIGLAVGLPAALALSRLIASLLFGVETYDSVTLVATVLILTTVCAAAAFLPANRASRIDPIQALRYE